MEPIEIVKLGRDMRNAQKDYWRIRTQTNLEKAKRLERSFDKAVKDCLTPSSQLCFENFNTLSLDLFDEPLEPLM